MNQTADYTEADHLLSVRNCLGEGPLWHAAEQALYWVDIMAKTIQRYFPSTGQVDTFDVGVPVGCFAFRQKGGLVLASGDGFAFWDLDTRHLDWIAHPEAGKVGSRFNDGKADPQGRFWAGSMSNGATSALYRLDADGSLHTLERGITISNGLGWSPDQRTMYYTDSPRRVIYAYDYDATSGQITNRRDFVRLAESDGVPDGLTVDEQGYVWSAIWGGWRVVRFNPHGQAVYEVRLPVSCPSSCTFGGANLNELYITSAWVDLNDAQRREQPWAGDVFRLSAGVRGLPMTMFAG